LGDDVTDIFALTSSGLQVLESGLMQDIDSIMHMQNDVSASGSVTIEKTYASDTMTGQLPLMPLMMMQLSGLIFNGCRA